ncbi:G-type lectin S-receptor-like serine/threonine-protein kinase [Vitis vinifera]|uniref:G-type lectin S-receptor-like serine/threonine-protein kinase n=1 Tax=Vitis vinifera TaxID=29760 RepID=A0A438G911_VITVI|nr:G-type lectin S-receptor-like serine/threonine-protein kinase [Vitis vinifera]
MDALTTLVIFLFYLISILRICSAVDTITVNQLIRDGQTITSAGGSFELGFFNPGSSKNRYLGIWYKKVATGTVVWVANREIPLTDSSGVLTVTDQGTLAILNRTNSIIWSSNPSRSAQNPNVQLLGSGNLVMKNGNDSDPENFLWQSFDYPGNTLLRGMKLGRDKVTGLDRYLSSWKSSDDPSKGNFTYKLDPGGHPQLFVTNGLAVKFSSGPWNGFFPKFQSYWDKGDWSSGCVRNASLGCHNGDGFVKHTGLKLPDTQKSWSNESMNLKECSSMCLRNCSCTAYANSDIRGGGSGCLLWFGDLIDIREFHETGQVLYVRMAASELDAFARINSSKRRLAIISSVSTIGIILLSIVLTCILKKKKQLKRKGVLKVSFLLPMVPCSGYMSPEYAIAGLYSTKSNVFSFGVSVLEMSGKRNREFYNPNYYINLLGYAWTLYMEGRSLELIDASMGDTCNLSEVLRSIHVGLLCVQRSPDDRPSMSSVILMLGSEGALPQPKRPGFFCETPMPEANSNPDASSFSGNEGHDAILEV